MPTLKNIKTTFTIPLIADFELSWEKGSQVEDAVWELYIELVTRISIAKLE